VATLQNPLPKSALTETAIAGPASAGAVAVSRAGVLNLRAVLITAFLFLVPLLTYWSATFHDFGLRDDYSNLREAHQEVGKVLKFCASHARPIYGWLLQSTFGQTSSVQNLQWLRFTAALLLGALSLVSFRGFRALGWSANRSLCFALMLVLVPASQVIASWAVGWPYAIAALLSFGAFFTAEGAFAMNVLARPRRAASQWAVALGLMLLSALIYQPSAMFYAVPMAAALIAQRRRNIPQTVRWMGTHVGLVAAGLILAYATVSVLYAAHIFVKSGRVAFEVHWVDKIVWFLREPLPNALSLFVINDNNLRDHALYVGCAVMVAALLAAGAALEWRRHGKARGLVWIAGLVALPTLAFGVSLIASERYATYRTVLAMTGVLLCFLIASVANLTQSWSSTSRRVLAVGVIVLAFMTAQHHAYALIAVPQGNEWQLIINGAKQVHLNTAHPEASKPSIFAIASSQSDISTATIYHDEFGSISSNSEWVPREMFKQAMHDLHPQVTDLESRYEFASGPRLPPDQHYDVVIDMHRLRQYYLNN
jgi:hypothetical protein